MGPVVILELFQHCIETAAKRAYHHLAHTIAEDERICLELQEKLTLLQDFLESSDFSKLRSEHPQIAGGTHTRVRLQRCKSGKITWRFES
jgi:hypothetical protein